MLESGHAMGPWTGTGLRRRVLPYAPPVLAFWLGGTPSRSCRGSGASSLLAERGGERQESSGRQRVRRLRARQPGTPREDSVGLAGVSASPTTAQLRFPDGRDRRRRKGLRGPVAPTGHNQALERSSARHCPPLLPSTEAFTHSPGPTAQGEFPGRKPSRASKQ